MAAELDLPCVVGVAFQSAPPGAPGPGPAAAPIEGRPILCGRCGAALCDSAAVRRIEGVGHSFACAFCGAVVVIDRPPSPGAHFRTGDGAKRGLGPVVVGVIDVSSSMTGGGIGAAKASLINTVSDLEANAPATEFGLVTFAYDVTVYGVGKDGSEHRFLCTEYFREKAARAQVSGSGITPAPIAGTAPFWRDLIGGLGCQVGTALGLGLVAGSALVEGRTASRLVLLTDGLACVGMGAFIGPTTDGGYFYANLAWRLARAGVVVDLVAIAGQGRVELQTLRILPESTGGRMFYVEPTEVKKAFEIIDATRIAARKARLKVVLPHGVHVTSVSGIGPDARPNHALEFELGNVADTREVYFAIEPDEGERPLTTDVPVQVQLHYHDDDGAEHLEVRHTVLTPSGRPEELRREYDPGPLVMMEIQKGGEEASRHSLGYARARLASAQARVDGLPPSRNVSTCSARIEQELKMLEDELMKHGALGDDSSAAHSHALSRRSSSFYGPETS